jgi:hypothetical protein
MPDDHTDADAELEPVVGTPQAGDPSQLEEPDKTVDADAELDGQELDAETDNYSDDDDDSETDGAYPARTVRKLRKDIARYRTRARELSEQLWTARVAALGVLADPTDMPYNGELLDDADALAAAVAELVERKPHLRSRRITGRVGQGERGQDDTPSLSQLLRLGAMP